MFTGDYSFFDYKYDISGYTGQDFGGPAQYLYLGLSALLLAVLLRALRRAPERRVRQILRLSGLLLTLLYLGKTAWESVFDLQRFGAFNTGLLPLDTCSLVMPAALLAGWHRGRAGRMAACWLVTGGLVGGIGAMVRLNAFQYYPFCSFGACYSMLWHFWMVFLGLLLAVTGFCPREEEQSRAARLLLGSARVRRGFTFHLLASVPVIAVDYLFGFDFMLYRELGGVPFFESVGAGLIRAGLGLLNPLLMLALYLAAFRVAELLAEGARRLCCGKRQPAPGEMRSAAGIFR